MDIEQFKHLLLNKCSEVNFENVKHCLDLIECSKLQDVKGMTYDYHLAKHHHINKVLIAKLDIDQKKKLHSVIHMLSYKEVVFPPRFSK